MAHKKISPMLSKLLSDVEVESLVVGDEEIVKVNEELIEATETMQEDTASAEMLSEAIEELEIAKEDVEAGLQSGVDYTSARLLATRLKNAMSKLDSDNTILISGLQSDNYVSTLQAGLLAADGIIKKAVDILKALWKKITSGILFIWDSIKKFFAWIFGSTKKTNKDLEDLSNSLDEVDEILKDVSDLPQEDKEEIVKNAKRRSGFKIPDDNEPNSNIEETIFNILNPSKEESSDAVKRFKARMDKKSEKAKDIAEVIIEGVVLNNEEFTKEKLEKEKKQMIFELTQKHFLLSASKVLNAIINSAAVDVTVDNNFGLKSLFSQDYIPVSSEIKGFPYEVDLGYNSVTGLESKRSGILKEFNDKIEEMTRGVYVDTDLESIVSKKDDFLEKNIMAKIENIESYVDQIESVLNKGLEFDYSVLSKNKDNGLFLIYDASVNTKEKNNFKSPIITFDALVGNSFSGGTSDQFRIPDGISTHYNAVHDLSIYDHMGYDSFIRELSASFGFYSKGIGKAKAATDKVSLKHKDVQAKLSKIVETLEKGKIATGEAKGTESQYKFIAGISEIVQNMHRISRAMGLYTKAVSAPQTIVSLMLEALDKNKMDIWIKEQMDKQGLRK